MKDVLTGELGIVDFRKDSVHEVIVISEYNGLIDDDEIWLEMLMLQNELSHIHDGDATEWAAHVVMATSVLANSEKDTQIGVGGCTHRP
ncbi:MAG: nucleotidyltransferase substrate binding protein [Olsenella sp.]|nr:nucleotidyltransferase substrate binding protein [Olsenella sp.]